MKIKVQITGLVSQCTLESKNEIRLTHQFYPVKMTKNRFARLSTDNTNINVIATHKTNTIGYPDDQSHIKDNVEF